MSVTMEIIKVGVARPVAWRWYRKIGRIAMVDYYVGKRDSRRSFERKSS